MAAKFHMKQVTTPLLLHMLGNELRFPMLFRVRCMFHDFAISVGIPEMTPVVCQIDNAMFNSYLPDEMTFDHGPGRGQISDGRRECNFVWQLRERAEAPVESSYV